MLNFFFAENSSLNLFFSPDGKKVFISTSTTNLPGPILALKCKYPKSSTGQKYQINNCVHDFQHKELQQLRRGDEAPSSIMECSKCKYVRVGQ